ncbi:MAG: hypothetical protein NVV60_00610 [Luteimonas sp.]|nr:hypothetical protein [Luteimonas sp.]
MTKPPAKKAPAERRGRESTILGADVPPGWGYSPPMSGEGVAADFHSTMWPAVLESGIDDGWLKHLFLSFSAWLHEADPKQEDEDAAHYCRVAIELLKEHQEQGINTRELLLTARKMAGRINVSNMHRHAFVGVVATGATGDKPKRTRTRPASKTPELIRLSAVQWVQERMFNERGEQVARKSDVLKQVQKDLSEFLSEKLTPKLSVVEDWYDAWLGEQPESTPRPAHGNRKRIEKRDSP